MLQGLIDSDVVNFPPLVLATCMTPTCHESSTKDKGGIILARRSAALSCKCLLVQTKWAATLSRNVKISGIAASTYWGEIGRELSCL